MVSVPVDEVSLKLLETALDYHFKGIDDEGNPIGVGEFSLHRLLDLWSGYDSSLEEVEDDGSESGLVMTVYRGGPVLTSKDVILALIAEVRRLRGLDKPALKG